MKQTENYANTRSINFPRVNGSVPRKVRPEIKKEQPHVGTTPLEPFKDTHFQSQPQVFPPIFEGKNNPDETSNNEGNLKKEPDLVLLKMAAEAEIDLSKPLMPPQKVLTIDEETVFCLGDFSLTIGKAKSRKTFFTSLLMALLVGNINNGRIKAELPKNKNVVLFFDTEQGKYHAFKTAKNIHRLLGVSYIKNFKAFSLRKYFPKQRLEIIELFIYNTPNLGVVFIDGIRDLVTSINDEEQATKISSKLLKWSDEKQIHINCILHMNKGDNNARGHLGTEMLNKSLVTIAVSKNAKSKDYSTVEIIESREKEPKPFMLGIDEAGLPYIVFESHMQEMNHESHRKKGIYPEQIEKSKHLQILQSILFQNKDEMTYRELVQALKESHKIGENKAKMFIAYFVEENLLINEKHGNRTVYSMV